MPRPTGLLPPTPARPRLRIGKHLAASHTVPDEADWLSQVGNWDMYRNDQIGDCGPASGGHYVAAASTAAGHPHIPTVDDVIDLYRRVSGYDPATGRHDDGVIMQDLLSEMRKGGLAGKQILAFAEVDVSNRDEVDLCIDLFGGVLIGANMPRDAEVQFDAGQPWTPTSGRGGRAGSWGGHAMHAGRYSRIRKARDVTTWGRVQVMTDAWWYRYVAEAWVIITEEWVQANGFTPSGLDLYGLGRELAELTGEPNPIPAPQPAPTPVLPAVDANAALVAAFEQWRQVVNA
ncbi:MAG TPA: hypothetical protein VFP72_08870 [Kineosporiaceae bacterium]|nr:hypothetical protein [Kineosporiaceae bacterium]